MYNKIKKEIQHLLNTNPNGQFTHNIISMKLRELSSKEGKEKANELIDDLNLPYNKA